MSQKTKLPAAKQSIRLRTLIYFMVMALAMITLLWAVQEWFFSTQYADMKQKEVVNTLNDVTKDLKRPYPTYYFLDLQKTAANSNMAVYFFCFKKMGGGNTSYTEYTDNKDGKTYLMLNGNFFDEYVLFPTTEKDAIYTDTGSGDDLGWTHAQQDRFIKMLGLNESLTPQKAAVWEYDKDNQKLYYAIEAGQEVYSGEITHMYFYVEAAIAANDTAINIIRFEFILLTVLCLLLAFVFSILLSTLLANPIAKISQRAEGFAKGNYNIEFGHSSIKEINNLAKTLDFAAQEFKKTEQLRREFLANISHDLRTPLTMVRAYAEMIRDISGANPEKRKQHSQVIIDEANRLSLLVEDIQKLSKIQAGTDSIKSAVFDLDELCASTVRQFGVMHEKFGYKLEYKTDGECPVLADRDKIAQVLYNLIGNAINYTNKQDKRIIIRLIKKDDSAVVEIEDNGKGIAEEDIDAVWDRYYRLNQEKRSVVGSGLGLSIVKNILVAHSAVYGVKSELNKGTVFWFALPLTGEDAEKPTKAE